ncbi:MAG: type VI secretion system tip protein TssI/VgrG [Polyangiaceae bacterium]
MPDLELSFRGGDEGLSVRRFEVNDAMSRPFSVRVTARAPSDHLAFESFVGHPAAFTARTGLLAAKLGVSERRWSGVCRSFVQTRFDEHGLSTYDLVLVPRLWLLSLRSGYRLFQHLRVIDIVEKILGEHGIVPEVRLDRERYPRLELRTQYGESDLAFVSRLLEEAGIAYFFETHGAASGDLESGSPLILTEAPQRGTPRPAGPLPFVDAKEQAQAGGVEHVTAVHVGQEMRTGLATLRGFDFRRPTFSLQGRASAAGEPWAEDYRHAPGAFAVEAAPGSEAEALAIGPGLVQALRAGLTPVADDQGTHRYDELHGTRTAVELQESLRTGRLFVTFRTSAMDIGPGVLFAMTGHAHPRLAPSAHLLVTDMEISGDPQSEWLMEGRAVLASEPYRPARVTPRPTFTGLQSAIVVGPAGEEIHTDEHGRVRVQFPWDREGSMNEDSSPWIRVSQGWAGSGYGLFTIPRIGHEVLVAFLNGDVDQPVIVGRLHNGPAQVPHRLPQNKTVSTWKSCSSPAGGGFNELRFEDAKGREHVYVQAEKDLDTLVKNDEMGAVGHDRTRVVQHDETVAVGHDSTRVVGFNSIDSTGQNRVSHVGVSQVSAVGVDDTHLVGSKYSVTMARGMSEKLALQLTQVLDGQMGPVLKGFVANVLGVIPSAPLGGLSSGDALLRGHLAGLRRLAPGALRGLLDVLDGFTSRGGPPPTSFEMVDRRISLTTGEASIVLDGPNVSIMADGNIVLHAKNNVAVLADEESALAAEKKVLVMSAHDDVIVQGAPNVHLNPQQKGAAAARAAQVFSLKPETEEAFCSVCGGQMVQKKLPDGRTRLVCEREKHAAPAPDGAHAPFDPDEAESFEASPDELDDLWHHVAMASGSFQASREEGEDR